MIKIKMCGMCRPDDIEYANLVQPEYVGYIFAPSSKRYISHETAAQFTRQLDKNIIPVGVFKDEDVQVVTEIVNSGSIRMIQLHGNENDDYITDLREQVDLPIIKAFKIRNANDVKAAKSSAADMILLDSGEGSGELFDHSLLENISRPYFLAGGLDEDNIGSILNVLSPYAVDVSSGIELNGNKQLKRMQAFANAVRRKQ